MKKHDQVKYTCKHIGRVSFGAAARVRLTVRYIYSPPGGTAFSSRPGHPVDAPGTPGCSAHRKPRKLRLRERISDSRAGTRQWPTRCARSSSAGTNTFTLHLTSYNRQSGLFAPCDSPVHVNRCQILSTSTAGSKCYGVEARPHRGAGGLNFN